MQVSDGSFDFAWAVVLRAPPTEVVPSLVEPARMVQWMAGIDTVDPVGPLTPTAAASVGARVRVRADVGAYAGWTFLGELVVAGPTRFVRRYTLQQGRAGVAPLEFRPEEYVRTVVYLLVPTAAGGTDLRCEVQTRIPGQKRRPARAAAKAELKSLQHSLERLSELTGGDKPSGGLFGRSRQPAPTASPL